MYEMVYKKIDFCENLHQMPNHLITPSRAEHAVYDAMASFDWLKENADDRSRKE